LEAEKMKRAVTDSKFFMFEKKNYSARELSVLCGGYERYSPTFELKRNSYPYYVLEFPLKGKCFLTINSKRYLLEKGKIAGFAPNTPHFYQSDPLDPLEHIFVIFTGHEAKDLFSLSQLMAKRCFQLENTGEINYLIRAILKNGLKNNAHSYDLCNHYLKVLFLELASQTVKSNKSYVFSFQTFDVCVKYVENHFDSIASVNSIAEACHINSQYLSRLFQRYAQCTPQEYVNRLKMNKAGVLLLTTELPISRVGELVGYKDQYHFSRNFKKYYGTSPRAYREIHIDLLLGNAPKEKKDDAC
jgi:AraC-like DNA-binding protein